MSLSRIHRAVHWSCPNCRDPHLVIWPIDLPKTLEVKCPYSDHTVTLEQTFPSEEEAHAQDQEWEDTLKKMYGESP